MADADPPRSVPPAPIVAVAAWLLPGAGYWLIGQRSRAITVGISILALFVIGLLVGGVRVIEVPGYNTETGERQMVDVPGFRTARGDVFPPTKLWALKAGPLNEVRNKPWSLPQLMTGPVAVAAGAWSVIAARPSADHQGEPDGALTHARINEIGSLYLSVAGLLNLMAIIDAAHRAVHLNERSRSASDPAEAAA